MMVAVVVEFGFGLCSFLENGWEVDGVELFITLILFLIFEVSNGRATFGIRIRMLTVVVAFQRLGKLLG